MGVLDQLSSQSGDRSSKSNLKIVAKCLGDPGLLGEIADGLKNQSASIVGDCAEVFTEVAKERPDLVAPYAKPLSTLLSHKTTRVRWEAMHSLALVTTANSTLVATLLPRLHEIIRSDPSVIVRDYAVDTISNYAKTSKKAALAAHPLLIEALTLWNGKQAAHALNGLINVASAVPSLRGELRNIGVEYQDSGRGVVRQAAKALNKATDGH